MNGLGLEARALIEEASRQEGLPSERTLLRVRRSIAYQAMAVSAAALTSSTTMGAKAGLLGAGLTLQLASAVVAGALTGGALIAVSSPLRNAPSTISEEKVAQLAAPRAATASIPSSNPSRIQLGEAPTADLAPTGAPEGSQVEAAPAPIRPDPRIDERASAGSLHVRRQPFAPRDEEAVVSSAGGARATAPPQAPSLALELELELEVLRNARRELQAGHAEEVLIMLGQYEPEFRGGVLEEQARIARVAALCQLGRDDQARMEIADIARHWPNSSVTRLPRACGRSDGTTPDR
jgi:hypothetical protein